MPAPTLAIPYRLLKTAAIAWLGVPVLIFLAAWLRPAIGLPLASLVAYAGWRVCRSPEGEGAPAPLTVTLDVRASAMLLILLLWYALSGIGAFGWQEPWDHAFRNAVYADLVSHPWPVTAPDGSGGMEILCYYFGFWLPAALVEKAFHSPLAGRLTLFAYGLAGVLLAFLLVCRHLRGLRMRHLIVFILFGGCDIIVYALQQGSLAATPSPRTELAYTYFCSAPVSVQLYFIYNSAVAAWLVCLLYLPLRRGSDAPQALFLLGLLTLFAPMVCVALAPYAAWLLLRGWRRALTAPTLAALLLAATLALFYSSHNRAATLAPLPLTPRLLALFAAFIALNYLVYMAFVGRSLRRDPLFLSTFLTALPVMFFAMGDAYDLGWRVTIPSAFYLMLHVMARRWQPRRRPLRAAAFAAVLVCGMVPSVLLVADHLRMTVAAYRHSIPGVLVADDLPSVFLPSPCRDNFVGAGADTFFVRALMRRTGDGEN